MLFVAALFNIVFSQNNVPGLCTENDPYLIDSGWVTCDFTTSSCKNCTLITCNDCEKLTCKGTDECGDIEMIINGLGNEGAKIICEQEESCQNTNIFGTEILGIDCKDKFSCKDSVIYSECLDRGCQIKFDGINSFENGIIYGKDVRELNCNGKESCMDSIIEVHGFISNISSNPGILNIFYIYIHNILSYDTILIYI